jgi:hypothetical protein
MVWLMATLQGFWAIMLPEINKIPLIIRDLSWILYEFLIKFYLAGYKLETKF